ncbi:MAG: PfkB family carbohydrate kinase [Bifidobacteriaceae bacterium]|jgi:sugar/nucleoside kinase (ribokinase family)|nr:PfkB family carbohydrate kinase [Bifidobacteriaceae bacterium]
MTAAAAGPPGRLIHTGQVVVDLVLGVSAWPPRGGDTFARWQTAAVGGGFNVMAAARREGAAVVYTGGHGSGPFGDMARAALAASGVTVTAPASAGRDTGFSVVLVDDAAERTFVSAAGAEFDACLASMADAKPTPRDLVYVSGYSLAQGGKRPLLLEWLAGLDGGVRVLFDPSPLVGELPADALGVLASRRCLWSLNLREATSLAQRPELWSQPPVSQAALATACHTELASGLALALGRAVILRLGEQGAMVAQPPPPGAPPAPARVVEVPAQPVVAVDTNGAGDAHCGALAAALLRGLPLVDAVRRANAVAALAVTRPGPADWRGSAHPGADAV